METELIESIYHGCKLSKLPVNPNYIKKYNEWKDIFELPDISDNPIFTGEFIMPDEYKEINVQKYLHLKCKNDIERERVDDELYLFEYSGKLDFVKYLIYLVDQMKKANIIWGVGRGSSVSVFIFYLIGIHKVNSIKYGLEFTDFFKIKE